MTTLDKIKAEIQKVLEKERDFTTESAKAQALALFWVLELLDKYAEQEPCEDAISRQAVLDVVEREPYKGDALSEIEKLPPVRLQEQTGHWIEHEHGFWSWVNKNGERDGWIPDYECSECGSRAWKHKTNYCPQCGAWMVEPQESEG